MKKLNNSGMQENEFEKQLKQMMDGFEITPSASVWEKVRRRINVEKRKKRPFIFWLFGIGLLLGGGYFAYNTSQKQVQKANVQVQNSSSKAQPDSVLLSNPETLIPRQNEVEIKPMPPSENKANNFHLKTNVQLAIKQTTQSISLVKTGKTFVNQSNPENTISGNNAAPSFNNENRNAYKEAGLNKETVQNKEQVLQPAVENNTTIMAGDTVAKVHSNNNVNATDSSNILQQNKLAQHQSKTPAKNNYTLPKWQFGITASYGRSNISEALVSNEKSYPANLNSFNGGIVSNSPGNNSTPFRASNAYMFGVVAQRKIIKNGFAGAGLNFIHLSAKANIQNKVDSAYTIQNGSSVASAFYVTSFYQPGTSVSFTNTYNFIEIPVYFQQDLFYKHKLSLSYNAGFSVRQLIYSHALIYDKTNNIFYSKNDMFHNTQLQVLGGISLKISTGKTTSLYIGPQFSYSLSGLLKDNSSSNFHFVNYGLHAGFMLHK